MKVLILSCNTGEGHNFAGRAVEEFLLQQGHQVDFVDIMLLAGERTSRRVAGAYLNAVKYIPGFYSALYKAGGLITSSKRKSPVYLANTLLAKPLKRYLEEHETDVIVTPHLFAAETLTYMKHKGMLTQKTVAIATDYTCIPFWEETDCDYYVLPHPDLQDEYMARGMDPESMYFYGIPVRPSFCTPANKAHARSVCHIEPDAHVYLVMSGSMGFGKIQLFVAQLLMKCEENEHIIVICGNNKNLLRTLKKEFGRFGNVHIMGFTKHVADYMDACDVLFTKPGGLTSTEAAVKGIPIVHTNPIPGCESKNVAFFTSHGMSVTAKKIRDQIALGQQLVRDADLAEDMVTAQKTCLPPDAALNICHLLEEICNE